MAVEIWDDRWKSKKNDYLLKLNPYGSRFMEILKDNIPQKRNLRILEVGCGSGRFLYNLQKYSDKNHLNWNLSGCDISEESVNLASKYLKNIFLKSYENIKKSYDIIFENGTIEHFSIKDYRKFLKWAHGHLKTKGKIIITNTNKSSMHYYHWKLLGKKYEYGFIILRTQKEMSDELMRANFKVVKSLSYAFLHIFARYFGRLGRFLEEKLYFLEKTKLALRNGFMNVCIAKK